jgi:hypothetical protein
MRDTKKEAKKEKKGTKKEAKKESLVISSEEKKKIYGLYRNFF